MNWAVIQFPGSNCDQDCAHVISRVLGHSVRLVWHKDQSLGGADAVLVPGGFSYGDYLRCGAIARFSPIMEAVSQFADRGGLILGICNGFQILCEAGLLPGALTRNRGMKFECEPVFLRSERRDSPFTSRVPEETLLRMPIAHGEGRYTIDPEGLEELEANRQILWRYTDASGVAEDEANPNGSVAGIAGICNRSGNVAGMMPHPERASEPALGETSGRLIFDSMAAAFETFAQGVSE